MESASVITADEPAGERGGLGVVLRWVSILGFIVAGVLLLRVLPVQEAVAALEAHLKGLNLAAAILVFIAVYATATVLMMPGSILTVAAGVVFGLGWGVVAASLGSTLGAALAFLVARYLARKRVARFVARHPRLKAIDRAVSAGGWRIVALLRLSPVAPFNVQNYFYGVTSVRFWPCVLTSWIAMLPGTFMLVYAGYVGGEVALEETDDVGVGRWLLLGAGLIATVVLTWYMTRLARRELGKHVQEGGETEPANSSAKQHAAGRGWALAGVAVAALAVALYAQVRAEAIRGWIGSALGPPAVTMVEAYDEKPVGPRFDHAAFSALLARHVRDGGWVDYAKLKDDQAKLDDYLRLLATADFQVLGRDEKLALLINAYNACTLKLILEHYPIDSIKSIPEAKRWDDHRWHIGGNVWSLNDIEHKQIRPRFEEARIHFALVCAAVGCPPLRREAYTGEGLEAQLAAQTRYVHDHPRWFRFDEKTNVVRLTELYRWYEGDFEQAAGSALAFAARYAPALRAALDAGTKPSIQWLEYSWKLNDVKNNPR